MVRPITCVEFGVELPVPFFPLIFASFPLRLNLYLNIVSAVLGVGQMTLCLLTPRAVQY